MTGSPQKVAHAYDLASENYARDFINELDHKPQDREWLAQFADEVGMGNRVLDIGCGPGHTTDYLRNLGVDPIGIDLSQGMIDQAKSIFPESNYEQGNMLSLTQPDRSVSGILAFYCIVHLSEEQFNQALKEMARVLKPGGVLLMSFHAGSGTKHVDGFLDTEAVLDFYFFEVADVHMGLTAAGFDKIDLTVREPYEIEYPSPRCYVFARTSR